MADLKELQSLASEFAPGPVLIHSDVMKMASFVGPYQGKEAFLQSHWDLLQELAEQRPLWFPSYNYDFPKTGLFDVQRCPSQVGALSEFVRCRQANWRTNVPVYSIVGTGPAPTYPQKDVFYPFGANSAFEQLLRQDGQLLFYGAEYRSNTFGHYLEHLGNNLQYRYAKRFTGQLVTHENETRPISVEYHCRPWGHSMDYGFDRVLGDLHREGIARFLSPNNSTVILIHAKAMADYCLFRFKDDPYYLLNAESRSWVIEKVQQLGRPFCLADFEPAEETRAAG